jgi:hypothetical protein
MSRVILVSLGAGTLAMLWNVPRWMSWDDADAANWLAALQLAGPLTALGLGALAAARSRGRDRLAWQLIAAGSLLYVLGNIAYIVTALSDGVGTFPTLPDLAFFVMALLFGGGISLYSRRQSLSLVINTYNFALLYGAVIFGMLFLLHNEIKASRLNEFATIVAFLYPALWAWCSTQAGLAACPLRCFAWQ